MIEQPGKLLVDVLVLDRVVVVEHEHELTVERRELVHQRRQCKLEHVVLPAVEHRRRFRADAVLDCTERLHDIGPELRGVVVGLVQRKPSERPRFELRCLPVRQQRGLARAGGRLHHGELARAAAGEDGV